MLQVLVTRRRIAWLPDSDGNVPNGALPVGETQNGETLYMGRVEYYYALTPGKVLFSRVFCTKRMLSDGRTLLRQLACYVTL